MIEQPTVLWHWVTCAGCGGTVYAKNQDLRHQAVRPLCCSLVETPALFGKEPPSGARIHPTSDTTKRMLCMACGYIKKFGAPPANGAEGDDPMKKKTKAPKAHGVGSRDAANGKPLASLGEVAKITRPERVERKRYHEFLPVRVPDSEKLEAHAELSRLEGDRLRLKSEKREVLARFREKFNALDVDIEKLVEKGNDGVEKRRVECVDYLLSTNEIEMVRQDTGEVVLKRTATAEELQESLLTLPAPKADGKKARKERQTDPAPPPAPEPPFGGETAAP